MDQAISQALRRALLQARAGGAWLGAGPEAERKARTLRSGKPGRVAVTALAAGDAAVDRARPGRTIASE
jgi:hypothetical protein